MRTKEEIALCKKKSYLKNKDIINENSKIYYLNNKEKIATNKRDYRLNNKEKINKRKRTYEKKKRETDDLYKLTRNLRCLIGEYVRRNGGIKNSKTSEILGCDFDEFKKYLESKFEPWMNWSNYGNWNGCATELNVSWDIDHIVPFSTASTEEDLMKLNHYSNLQPLCSYTNRHIKRDNVHN